MSEPPDRNPSLDNTRCQSPTESLSNWRTSDYRLSPNDMIVPTPTDLDTTESVYEEIEYLEEQTPTDLDTTESVINITIESTTVIAVENEHIRAGNQNILPSTPPEDPEESFIDDSVEDPNYIPPNETDRTRSLSDDVNINEVASADDGDKTETLSDISRDEVSQSVFNVNDLMFRTSTPLLETRESIDEVSQSLLNGDDAKFRNSGHSEISFRNERSRLERSEELVPNSENYAQNTPQPCITHNENPENNGQEVNIIRAECNQEELGEQENFVQSSPLFNPGNSHNLGTPQSCITLNENSENNGQEVNIIRAECNQEELGEQENFVQSSPLFNPGNSHNLSTPQSCITHNDNSEKNGQEVNIIRAECNQEELAELENIVQSSSLFNPRNSHNLGTHSEVQQVDDNQNFSKSEKRFAMQLEKEAERINKLKIKHPINLTACNNCSNKCVTKFNVTDRQNIYNAYWNLNYSSRRKWLASCVKIESIKRRRVSNAGAGHFRKKESRIYVLKKNEKDERVCLSFFLKTLGYTSDSVITELRKATKRAPLLGNVKENRGRKKNVKKCNYRMIQTHINSYNPCVAHYRRHNAPNARYLPMGLTLKDLYSDFHTNHPNVCSKETYRKVLFDMGVSLHKPESDLCADCAVYEKQKSDYQEKGEDIPEDIEQNYKKHSEKAKEATEQYKKDKEEEEGTELKIYSMDLEKVILLPIMPKLKDSFFVSRLIVFNETFASLKSGSQSNYCCVWHEALAGRDAPQIVDSLLVLLKEERDTKNFVFWADNCVGQNKNWYLYTALVTIVNSNIAGPIQSITFKYLTKGHTHMTADAIHGNIEKAIKKKGDVYDYKDLLQVMKMSRQNLNVVEVTQFHKWPKKKRTPRRQNDNNLQSLKLHNIVEVKFNRGSRNMLFKESFIDQSFKEVNFLQFKFNEKTEPPQEDEMPRGISKKKKEEIINKLVRVMPTNRQEFWYNLSEKNNVLDLVVEGQMENVDD